MSLELPIKNRFSLHGNHGLWLFVFLLCTFLQVGGYMPGWRYDFALIDSGQYWLILSGNMVHLNWAHWGLNMTSLLILTFFFSAYGRVTQWLFVFALSSIFVGVGLYWFNPETITYVGLSGTLHGLYIYGASREMRVYPASGYALMTLLVGKLIWESFYGALPGSEELTDGRVVVESHIYGGLGGGLAIVLLWLFNQLVKIKDRQQNTEHNQQHH